MVALIIFASQIAWKPIHRYYDPTQKNFEHFKEIASEIAKNDPKQGRILLPEYWPPLTYMLVHFGGIKGNRFVSQAYDPFFYIGEGAAFEN